MSSGGKKLVVLLVLLIGGGIAYAFLFMDDSPPDVTDLKITYENIPENENAFTYFEKAGQLIKQYEEKGTPIETVHLSEYNFAVIGNQIAQNQQALNLLQQGLMCKKMQVPKIDSLSTLLPYLQPWRSIARLQSNRALHLFMSGQQQAALNVLTDTMRFGSMVENSKGCLINHLVGIAINAIGRSRFRELLAGATLPPAHLKGYIKLIDHNDASIDGMADALRIEYITFSNAVKDIEKGKISIDDFEKMFTSSESSKPTGGKKPSGYSFKPNTTRKMYAGIIATAINNNKVPYNKITVMDKKTEEPTKAGKGPNAQGKFLVNLLLPALDRAVEQGGRNRIDTGATQLMLALKCYKMVNGDLPDSLDKLVPNYIDSIPADYYDGKPLRYSKAKRVIYCIGQDLKDDGGPDASAWEGKGNTGNALWKERDPGYLINF